MKSYSKKKKVVIVTEAIILNDIIKLSESAGADGYTVTAVTGKGPRGVRRSQDSFISILKNIKIEIVTSEEVANKIIKEVVDKFYKYYAGIVYVEDVEMPKI